MKNGSGEDADPPRFTKRAAFYWAIVPHGPLLSREAASLLDTMTPLAISRPSTPPGQTKKPFRLAAKWLLVDFLFF
jgi:hypothetical protein